MSPAGGSIVMVFAPWTIHRLWFKRSYGFALFLGACAIANTPQQDLAYARWATCNSTSATLERIDLDGRITFRISNEGSRQETLQCLAEAGRTGPPLPEPVGVWPPSGP